MTDPSNTIFRVEAIRYGADGFPLAVRWRILPLDPTAPGEEAVDIATIDEAVVVAHANRLYSWGDCQVVNRIRVGARAFGGLMLVDAPDASNDARLARLPTF